MKPQKFLQTYKCDCFQPDNFCNCTNKQISSDVLIENITDAAETLIEVMHLCGIKKVDKKAVMDVITYYFLHFEEVLHRVDAVPRKRVHKEDLILDLCRNCGMNRRQSQMAFSIIKRAFKAFYHGTGEGGVPSRFKDKLTHSSECLWVHAAHRTAEICACYMDMFYATQKDLECKIKSVYKQLYDRMEGRASRNDDHECMCIKCTKRIKKETLNPQASTCDFHAKTNPYEVLFLREQKTLLEEENGENDHNKLAEAAVKQKLPCSCPSLSMLERDYKYRKIAESTQFEAVQGPFECRWYPICKEEFEADESGLTLQLPEQCPCYPCQPSEESDFECECESDCDCECDCEDCEDYETDLDSDMECDVEVEVEE